MVFEEIGLNSTRIERLSYTIATENEKETQELREKMGNFETYLEEILRYCGRYGIYFIFISQLMGDMRNAIRGNVRYKIAHQMSEEQSLIMFDNKSDASRLGDKEGVIQIGTDNSNLIKFKSPLAKKYGILEELKEFIDKRI